MAGEAFVVKELPGPADGDQMIDEDLPFRVRKPAMASGQKRLDVAAGGFADEPAFLKVEFVMDEIARMGLVAAGAATPSAASHRTVAAARSLART